MECHAILVCMEEHAGEAVSQALAAEVRSELAVQRRTANDLAAALGITPHTAGRRLAALTPFSVIELARAAEWLGVAADVLIRRAEVRAASQRQAVAS